MVLLLGYDHNAYNWFWRYHTRLLLRGTMYDLYIDYQLHSVGLQHQLRGFTDRQHSLTGHCEEQEHENLQETCRQKRN